MNPQPLIKWKSFWLGILVLGFLGWAWVRSDGYKDAIGSNMIDRYWEFFQEPGVFLIGVSPDEGAPTMIKFVSTKRSNVVSVFPKGILWEQSEEGPDGVYVGVAHWLLILLFLVPWVSFLAWRYRRQRKLTETNASAFP